MDIISFNEAATANGRIESFIENPDSKSGLVSLPKKIDAGESVTIPDGRVVVHPNLEIDGTLTIEDGGELFVPFGGTLVSSDLMHPVDTIADLRNETGKYKYVYVTGYHTKDDGAFGSNIFVWDESSTETDNGGAIIKCTTVTTGRYKLKYSGYVNVRWFGAKSNNIGDNSSQIQKAIDYVVYAGGGSVYFPSGIYRIEKSLILDTGIYGNGISIFGDGRDSQINQVGINEDAIIFSTTQFLQNSYIKDISIVSSDISGNAINIKYGCTTCKFENLDITVLNTNKSCFIGDYTSFGGGIFDTKFSGGTYYLNTNAVAPGFNIKANGTIFNENIFENLRVYNSSLVQFFSIRTVVSGGIWLCNNSWKNINFEVCSGGGFIVDSLKNCKFENISFWDTPIYNNHLLHFTSGTGYESVSNTVINYTRNGDTLNTGIRDILISSGHSTVIINPYVQPADNPSYDFNGKVATCIGAISNIINNQNVTFINNSPISGINTTHSYISEAYLDNIRIGGRAKTYTADITFTGNYLVSSTNTNGSGYILNGKTASGTARGLVWDTTQLYVLGDNLAALGTSDFRWSTIYAASGTINTSDDREKTYIDITEAEKQVAVELKANMKKFKFNDAITEKGEDKARIHFGASAQTVKAIFEKYGLVAEDYAIVCYDEWEEQEEVLDDNGNILKPYKPAGNRYGLRYEELLCFIISAI